MNSAPLSENSSSQTTLVILLGASHWPYHSQLTGSRAFSASADKVRQYFCDPRLFGLPSQNWLDLFDQYQNSPDEVDQRIGTFLTQRIAALKQAGTPARDLLFYYMGHGVLTLDDVQAYHLAILSTRKANIGASAVAMASLAYTLKTQARHLRRMVILDCCFAAKAFPYLAQSSIEQMIQQQTQAAFEEKAEGSGFPRRGTALLCSSGQQDLSFLLPDQSGTMFSEALVAALVQGDPRQPDKTHLSLHELNVLTEDVLETLTKGEAPKTFIASPDQRDGRVDLVPFFPNTTFRTEPTHKEKRKQVHRIPEGEGAQKEASLQPENMSVAPQPQVLSSPFPPSVASPPAQMDRQTFPTGVPRSPAPRPPSHRKNARVIGLILLILLLLGGTSSGVFLYRVVASNTAPFATATGISSAYDAGVGKNGVHFGFDTSNSRYNPFERILSPHTISGLKTFWSSSLGEYRSTGPTGRVVQTSSPVVAHGVVYVGSYDYRLYAFPASGCGQRKNCPPLWTGSTYGVINSSPAVVDGVVYVGSGDGKLYAFSANGCRQSVECQPLWTGSTGGAINSSPVVVDRIVYVGSGDGKLYAFPASGCRQVENCAPLWTGSTGGVIDSSPAVDGGVVYVGSEDGKLYAFPASNCVQVCYPEWSVSTGAGIFSSPAVANGIVFVGSKDGKLYAFQIGSCEQSPCEALWTGSTRSLIISSPAVANGIVFVGSEDHNLYAFSASGCGQRKNCPPLWTGSTGADIDSSPIVANGVVYIGSYDGKLYMFPATDCGKATTCLKLGVVASAGSVITSPMVANGAIYVVPDQGLLAFHL